MSKRSRELEESDESMEEPEYEPGYNAEYNAEYAPEYGPEYERVPGENRGMHSMAYAIHPHNDERNKALSAMIMMAQNGFHTGEADDPLLNLSLTNRAEHQIWDVPGIKNAPYGKDKRTRLMYNAYVGNLENVKFLVERGSDVNLQNSRGCTALHFAIVAHHKKVADFLLDHGASDLPFTMIGYIYRIRDGEGTHREYTFSSKELYNISFNNRKRNRKLNFTDDDLQGILNCSANNNNVLVLDFLIRNDSRCVNLWKEYLWEPFQNSIYMRAQSAFYLLIKYVDVNFYNVLNYVLMHIAENIHYINKNTNPDSEEELESLNLEREYLKIGIDMLKALISRGAKIDAKDEYYKTTSWQLFTSNIETRYAQTDPLTKNEYAEIASLIRV